MNMIITAKVSGQKCGDYICGTLVGAAKVLTVIRHCQTSFLLVTKRTKTCIVKSVTHIPTINECQAYYETTRMNTILTNLKTQGSRLPVRIKFLGNFVKSPHGI